MVAPQTICDKHLLGEHVELHMLVGQISRCRRLDGYAAKGLIEPARIEERHTAIAEEMTRRGFDHKSPLRQPDIAYLPDIVKNATVDTDSAAEELRRRCSLCRARPRGAL